MSHNQNQDLNKQLAHHKASFVYRESSLGFPLLASQISHRIIIGATRRVSTNRTSMGPTDHGATDVLVDSPECRILG